MAAAHPSRPNLTAPVPGPDLPVTGAYGVPLLTSEGVAAVVALGMDWLVVRIDELPPEIEANDDEPAPLGLSAAEGWQIILAWQDNGQALRELVGAALAHAASLALPQ